MSPPPVAPWGGVGGVGSRHQLNARNNSFTCLRRISARQDLTYCAFEDDESFQELYDHVADPWQLHNLALQPSRSTQLKELDGVMRRMLACAGASCHVSQHRG